MDLDSINEWMNKMWELPGYAVVVILCVCLCYVFRFIPKFPNEAIPTVCVLLGAVLLPILAPGCPADVSLIVWRVKAAAIGAVVGTAAWAVHNKLLKQIEDKIPFLNTLLEDGSTKPAPPANIPDK